MTDLLTRDQAITEAGVKVVDLLDNENCEPTGTVGYNGACQGDDLIEWSATVNFADADGDDCFLMAIYYTTAEDEKIAADFGDWGAVNWTIAGYKIV